MTTKSLPTIDALRVRLAPALERAGVLRAYVIGSLATGKATEASDVDLLVVAESDKPMRHRYLDFGEVRKACAWPADVFPYTPEEVREAVASRRRFVVQALAEGVQIFERGSQPYALDRMVREAVIAEERGEYWAGEGTEWIEDAAGDLDAAGVEVAKGLVNYSGDEIRLLLGAGSDEIEARLGYVDEPELIHRDNLAVL